MSNSKRFVRMRNLALIQAIIILILVIALIFAVFLKGNSDDAVTVSTKPQVRVRPVINKEVDYYQTNGKKILLNDGSLGEIYLPVYENVPVSQLDTNSIVTRNGYSFYKENGQITSFTGIDVSEHQGHIDWEQVKAAGVDFAMIRVGYRSYGGGDITFDEFFAENLAGANAAGVKTGVYFFSQAITTDEAIAEADAVIDAIAPYDITYPVVYDWETIYDDDARTDVVSVEQLTDNCVAFCERVKSSGYTPMIYQNLRATLFKLDIPRLTDYDFWLAEYSDKPSYYYDYKMWQYSESGVVPGIEGNVDLNISFKDYSK